MSKRAIRWITALMGFSLIGLVIFQIYWVDTLITANEQAFKRDVQEALNDVVEKLEKKEAMVVAVDNFHSQFIYRGPMADDSSSIEWIESTFEKKVIEVRDFVHDSTEKPHGWQFTFDAEREVPKLHKRTKVSLRENHKGDERRVIVVQNSADSTGYTTAEVKVRLQRFAKKSEYVQLAMHELFSGKKTLKDRVESTNLDSLIRESLQNRGIDLSYDYGVMDPMSNILSVEKIANDRQLLLTSDLRTSLFPNDITGESGYLIIRFPGQQTFILSKIWLTLLSSVLLILVIISCFAYAIHTIFRQKKLSDIKNDFINNMTHEFKTPISTVSLACEALRDRQVSGTAGLKKRYLEIIDDENKRLGLQVEKVLQMAVIERKDFELKLEKVNVHEIIENALANITLQVTNKGGRVSKELLAEHQTLKADELHLTNIVYNLLDNANKYSIEKPDIRVATSDVAEGIVIKIIDQGIGMSKDMANKIFEKFYRIPTGNLHDVKGFGLGLAYVKNMVEAHGGHIKVQSELKKGSEFTVYLPYEATF